jgi:serine/threonine-protein kinase
MGVVWKARHLRLDRPVALKTIRAALAGEELRQRFEDEARAVARFDHPHLVRVFDSGEHEGMPWFALELVEGGNLATALKGGPWQPREAARLVAVLADAVDYAHQAGVVHRDLKPANVLLTADGRPKITDFGLARLLEEGAAWRTSSGCCLGTPLYMPPEQAAGLPGSGGRAADVFGLGAILYELLTGQPPFAADSAEEVLERARQGDVRPPRRLNPRVPRALERICLKVLAREPPRRHATARELARELCGYLARRRRLLLGGAALFGLLVLAASLAGFVWPGREAASSAAPEANRVDGALEGELLVRVWSKDGKPGVTVDQDGALPVRNGNKVQIEARLNRPGHIYLLWVGSSGKITPLYPWNDGPKLTQKDPGAAPPSREPRTVVYSPPDRGQGRGPARRSRSRTACAGPSVPRAPLCRSRPRSSA